MTTLWRCVAGFVLALTVASCSGDNFQGPGNPLTSAEQRRADVGKLFGDVSLYGGSDTGQSTSGETGVAVNSFLWRASLDTVAFMPLTSADPFGGVILTDWYAPPSASDERFKLSVFILTRQLRADGVRVSVFRQQRDDSGDWLDAPVDRQTNVDLENAILTRARQLRIASAG